MQTDYFLGFKHNIFLFFSVVILSAFVFICCSKSDNIVINNDDEVIVEEPLFKILGYPNELSITKSVIKDESTVNFIVRSNSSWKIVAKDEGEWIKASPSEGTNNGSFNIIVQKNNVFEKRIMNFVFVVDGKEQSIKLRIEQAEKEIPNSAISQEFFDPLANGYTLFWEDNFEGTKLDETKWRPRNPGPAGNDDYGFSDISMIEVKDGHLHLKYEIKGDRVMGIGVGTQETFMTTFGYFECRAQLQKKLGYHWSAFWMQSPAVGRGEDPKIFGAEIDIFEYYIRSSVYRMTHRVHWAYGPNQRVHKPDDSKLEGLSEGFHTFALEWTPERYTFLIDGLKYHVTNQGLSHAPEYMILSMIIPRDPKNITGTSSPDVFIIDYVRVYKKGSI